MRAPLSLASTPVFSFTSRGATFPEAPRECSPQQPVGLAAVRGKLRVCSGAFLASSTCRIPAALGQKRILSGLFSYKFSSDMEICPKGLSLGVDCQFVQDQKASQVCRYFQRGFCFQGNQCSYQHPQPPGLLEWGCRHSEPHLTLPGPQLGLTRRASEPTYLPSLAVGWGRAGACWGTEPGLEGLSNRTKEVGGGSWKSLSPARESSGALQLLTTITATLRSLLLSQILSRNLWLHFTAWALRCNRGSRTVGTWCVAFAWTRCGTSQRLSGSSASCPTAPMHTALAACAPGGRANRTSHRMSSRPVPSAECTPATSSPTNSG